MLLFQFQRLMYVASGALLLLCIPIGIAAQAKGAVKAPATTTIKPSVTAIDVVGLRKALTTSGRPLLVNFWATWCEPCREEFPDLVKLDAEYKGKIDFITISLDDMTEISTSVPKFLTEMKAEMPAYLLKPGEDDAAIAIISKNFAGALPFTILYDKTGKESYFRQGKVDLVTVRAEIDKLLVLVASPATGSSH
ncbi:MAG TPA: TlpA disulfide reductase family protein [Pyrinomonadaceae bacterium]|nr:TlpA disulfide reductase family protein [Pyrinomonadaceae bacterium]